MIPKSRESLLPDEPILIDCVSYEYRISKENPNKFYNFKHVQSTLIIEADNVFLQVGILTGKIMLQGHNSVVGLVNETNLTGKILNFGQGNIIFTKLGFADMSKLSFTVPQRTLIDANSQCPNLNGGEIRNKMTDHPSVVAIPTSRPQSYNPFEDSILMSQPIQAVLPVKSSNPFLDDSIQSDSHHGLQTKNIMIQTRDPVASSHVASNTARIQVPVNETQFSAKLKIRIPATVNHVIELPSKSIENSPPGTPSMVPQLAQREIAMHPNPFETDFTQPVKQTATTMKSHPFEETSTQPIAKPYLPPPQPQVQMKASQPQIEPAIPLSSQTTTFKPATPPKASINIPPRREPSPKVQQNLVGVAPATAPPKSKNSEQSSPVKNKLPHPTPQPVVQTSVVNDSKTHRNSAAAPRGIQSSSIAPPTTSPIPQNRPSPTTVQSTVRSVGLTLPQTLTSRQVSSNSKDPDLPAKLTQKQPSQVREMRSISQIKPVVESVMNTSNRGLSLEKKTSTSSTHSNSSQEFTCAVCWSGLDKKDKNSCYLECLHWFHYPCFQPWFKTNKTCPTCKTSISNCFRIK